METVYVQILEGALGNIDVDTKGHNVWVRSVVGIQAAYVIFQHKLDL